jgi:hypothetical protein
MLAVAVEPLAGGQRSSAFLFAVANSANRSAAPWPHGLLAERTRLGAFGARSLRKVGLPRTLTAGARATEGLAVTRAICSLGSERPAIAIATRFLGTERP